jgi:hypothetical protein
MSELVKTCGKSKLMDCPGNEWAKGSYSLPKPGEVTSVGPLLHSGFLKRIHFAGEHTCYAFTGYMEAALQSGIRVAEQIARRDGVLGRKRRTASRGSRPKKNVTPPPNVARPSPAQWSKRVFVVSAA